MPKKRIAALLKICMMQTGPLWLKYMVVNGSFDGIDHPV